jgi:Site-specific recombinases, DNA invertase Pin homologs
MNQQLSPKQETTPKIYSYRRVSSIKQTKGAGLEMQKEQEKLIELSESFGIPISDEVLDDAGLSAFHGEHTAKGSLGWFIAAVKSGLIAKGSILVIYSLDRFSRLEIDKAVRDLTGLTSEGIIIFSILENKMFGNPQEDNEQRALSLMGAQLVFARSHNESLTKSKRAQKLLKMAIERHQKGERSPDGYAYSIKVVGNDVWWVDNSKGDIRPHPIYWDIAKEVCNRLVMGESPYMIERWLNNSDIPSPIKRVDKKIHGAWSIHIIRRIHEHRALIGEKTINGILLSDYYPPLLNDGEYYRLIDARNNRKRPKSKRESIVSLFAGLPNVVCAHCGAGVHLNTEPKNNSYNYRCSGHYSCDSRGFVLNRHTYDPVTDDQLYEDIPARRGWTKRAALIEQALLQVCLDKIWLPAITEFQSKIPELNGQLIVIKEEHEDLNNRWAECRGKRFPNSLVERMGELEQQMDSLMQEIESQMVIESAHKYAEPETLKARWTDISSRVLDFNNATERLRMRELIRDSFQMIAIGRPLGGDRYTLHMLIKFKDGESRIISLSKSDMYMVGNMSADTILSDISAEYLSSIDVPINTFITYNDNIFHDA